MTGDVVRARPVVMSRIGYGCSAFVLVAFVVTALLMKTDNAGAYFTWKDQVGTVVIGVVVALLLIMPTWPRLVADREVLRTRAFLGGWRTIPWNVVVRVEFPSNVRFARIVLPGEETLALYAVQRLDRERAVETMRRLRELHAATRAET